MSQLRYLKVCPKCGSTNFQPSTGAVKQYSQEFILPSIDTGIANECKDCDYRGTFSDIREDLLEKFRKKLSKKK
jgi:predicted nucleic-acid-binding Zn-ribbon protein